MSDGACREGGLGQRKSGVSSSPAETCADGRLSGPLVRVETAMGDEQSGEGGPVYDKGDRRYKHVGHNPYPEFKPENDPRHSVGLCPNNIAQCDFSRRSSRASTSRSIAPVAATSPPSARWHRTAASNRLALMIPSYDPLSGSPDPSRNVWIKRGRGLPRTRLRTGIPHSGRGPCTAREGRRSGRADRCRA